MAIPSAKEMYEAALTAYQTAVSTGVIQSYSIAGRTITRRNIAELREDMLFWRSQAAEESNGFTTGADFSGGGS